MTPRVEVEVKLRVPCDSLPAIEEKLRRLGAKLEEEAIERDVYYAHPCRSFLATDEALRLRIKNDKIILTYKGPRRKTLEKARTEIEAPIDDRVREILEKLGFRPAVTVVKKRQYYRLPAGQLVTIDIVEDLGCFIEVEAETSIEISEAIKALEVEGEEVRETYAELVWKTRLPNHHDYTG